ELCVPLERRLGGNAWSSNDDISRQNTFRESSISLGVPHLLARAQTQAHSDRIGCRDPKTAVEVPPSRDHRCRAVGPFQRLDPHWRAKGRNRLLDDLHNYLTLLFSSGACKRSRETRMPAIRPKSGAAPSIATQHAVALA